MVDTPRTKSALLTTLFQDAQAAGISANDIRDLIVSLAAPMGGCYISTPATTGIVSDGVYVKAAGTTTSSVLASMTMPASNRLLYSGSSPRHFHIVGQVSVAPAAGANQDLGLQIWYYDDSAGSGSYLPMSEARTTLSSTAIEQITTHADVMMATNDYLELHVANHSSTNDITTSYGYMFAMGVLM